MKLVNQIGYLRRRFGTEKALGMLKASGFDGYDYGMDVANESVEDFLSDSYWQQVRELKACADRIGIPCLQAHAPAGENQMERLPAIIRSLEYAAYLGAEVIVVHSTTDNWHYYERKEALFESNMQLYKALIPHAQHLGIKVAVENLYGWDRVRRLNLESVCSHSEEFIRYIDTLNHECIVACVDTGHAQLVNEAPEHMILKLGSRVGALHVHDNTGIDDAHGLPYTGTINWDNVCAALAKVGYQGNFTFEAGRFFNQYMDDELIPRVVDYYAHVGRSLIRKIENSREV